MSSNVSIFVIGVYFFRFICIVFCQYAAKSNFLNSEKGLPIFFNALLKFIYIFYYENFLTHRSRENSIMNLLPTPWNKQLFTSSQICLILFAKVYIKTNCICLDIKLINNL